MHDAAIETGRRRVGGEARLRQVVNAPPRVVLPVLFKSHFNHLSLLFQINCLITTQFRVRRITLPVQKSCQLLARKYSPMSASTVAAAVSGSLDCPLLTAAGGRGTIFL